MNVFLKSFVLLSAMIPIICSCGQKELENQDPKPVQPEVVFGVQDDKYEVKLNEVVEFKAEIKTDGPVECTWSVDGEVIASTPVTNYIFKKRGTYIVSFVAFNDAGRVEKQFEVTVVGEKLVVNFDKNEDFNIKEGESVSISAVVTAGDKNTVHCWTVSGESSPVSESTEFSYTFEVSGDYEIVYSGKNSDEEEFAKTWKVKVDAKSLRIEFSVPEGDVVRFEGEPLYIKATALKGSAGLVHSWKVNGADAGSDALLKYFFTEAGDYTVTYAGANPQDEVSASWAVKVSARETVFIETFEEDEVGSRPAKGNELYTLKSGHSIATNNDNGKLDGNWLSATGVGENLYTSMFNSSKRILDNVMAKSSSTGTSGVFNYKFASLESKQDVKAIRLKIYFGPGDYYPWMDLTGKSSSLPSKINGQDFDPKNGTKEQFDALFVRNEWNVIEYDLQKCYGASSLNGSEQIQPRPFKTFGNQNSEGKADPATNSRISYFDDIEFLK